jgi:hypothetical protein
MRRKTMANIDNLKLSIALMERMQKEQRPFSMEYFVYTSPRSLAVYDFVDGNLDHPCGLVCCVGGFMMYDPEHNARGFTEDSNDTGPAFKHHTDIDAISVFWDVSFADAKYITWSASYSIKEPTYAEVIGRMKDLLAKYETA